LPTPDWLLSLYLILKNSFLYVIGDQELEADKLRNKKKGIGHYTDPLRSFATGHLYSSAEMLFGISLMGGRGVPRDVDSGLNWIQKSAGQGFVEAEFTLYELFTGFFVFRVYRRRGIVGDLPFNHWLIRAETPPVGSCGIKDLAGAQSLGL
jgi:hypothetical protein